MSITSDLKPSMWPKRSSAFRVNKDEISEKQYSKLTPLNALKTLAVVAPVPPPTSRIRIFSPFLSSEAKALIAEANVELIARAAGECS